MDRLHTQLVYRDREREKGTEGGCGNVQLLCLVLKRKHPDPVGLVLYCKPCIQTHAHSYGINPHLAGNNASLLVKHTDTHC